MESVKTNESELTSTMGNLLSTSKDEKNDASDSTPTSSTDAFTTTSTSQIAADDPISSTSSDTADSKKNDTFHISTNSPIMSSARSISIGDHRASFVSEKDLLDMNITDTSTEKITENVDDIVQDLENLLGEPTTTFDFIRPRESRKADLQDKELSMDLDEFSVEFQMPEEKPKEVKLEKTSSINVEKVDVQPEIIPQEETLANSEASVNPSEATPALMEPVDLVDEIKKDPENSNREEDPVNPEHTIEPKYNKEQEIIPPISSVSEECENLTLDSSKTEAVLPTVEQDQSNVTIPQDIAESGDGQKQINHVEKMELDIIETETVKKPQEEIAIEPTLPAEEKAFEPSCNEDVTKSESAKEEDELKPSSDVDIAETEHLKPSINDDIVEKEPLKEEIVEMDNLNDEFKPSSNEEDIAEREPLKEEKSSSNEEHLKPSSIEDIGDTEHLKDELKPSSDEDIAEKEPMQEEDEPSSNEDLVEKEPLQEKDNEETAELEPSSKEDIVEMEHVNYELKPTSNEDTAEKEPLKEENTLPPSQDIAEMEQLKLSSNKDITEREPLKDEEMTSFNEDKAETEHFKQSSNEDLGESEQLKEKDTAETEHSVEDVGETEHLKDELKTSSFEDIAEKEPLKEEEKSSSNEGVAETEHLKSSLIEDIAEKEPLEKEEKLSSIEDVAQTQSLTAEPEPSSSEDTAETKQLEEVNSSDVQREEAVEEVNSSDVQREEAVEEAIPIVEEKTEEIVKKVDEAEDPVQEDLEERMEVEAPNAIEVEAKEPPSVDETKEAEDSEVAVEEHVEEVDRQSEETAVINEAIEQIRLASAESSEDIEASASVLEEAARESQLLEVTSSAQQNVVVPIEEIKMTELESLEKSVIEAAAAAELPAEVEAEEAPSSSDLDVLNAISTLPEAAATAVDDNLETLLAVASLQEEEEAEKLFEPQENKKLKEPLVINVDDAEKERAYSPKITIKPIKEEVTSPESSKGSLKMTITKQADTMHSILKIYDPESDQHQENVPKLIIKPIPEQPQSPKMSTRSSKVFSPSSSSNQRSASPRITIKPILEPVKITIKPVLKPEERRHSPKLTIKPIVKPEEETHSPRVTIKPIVKPPVEEMEQVVSPRITIKPIVKPENLESVPRVTIKPIVKPSDDEVVSPKITIKPIVKPQESEALQEEHEDSVKERIVLKINKGNIPGTKESRKRELPQEEEKSEKLAKIKLKFSKEGGHPHIVQDGSHDRSKRQKTETEIMPGITITPISSQHSKLKEMLSCGKSSPARDKVVTIEDDDDDVTIVEDPLANKPSPIVISEESNQDIVPMDVRDPISDIPIFEITPECVKTLNPLPPVVDVPVTPPAPRKRGRPRKVPLQVREDFKDPKEEEPKPVVESTRPKRSCRGQSVRTTLGIKPRKPRGPGRGRGSKRGMGTRSTPTPTPPPEQKTKEPKAKSKQPPKDEILLISEEKPVEIDDALRKSPLAPPQIDNSTDRADIVMYEEETRMSAETSNSRAQTPAKQVVTSSIPNVDLVEESQSSVLSSATTESVKVRKGPRLEVHQEPEGAVISADQLAEYYWSGGGPFMLQEQVAQFLGIKSFKRKYPNIARRVVDMQERDFIRESGLAGEAMCDLGLTAVNSTDILDIMYSDFQDKYEEYCKHQRDRQAKDLTNKQKALSLAASQEKTKMDITQQAVQSAASWNANFNKARRDQRKACMDLQTLTIHFPKGKMKQINKPKLGHYPVALVPGQFTDYYKEFTATELNNLPLNTLCYDPVPRGPPIEMECESQTDGSGSESDSSTSDSDSSFTGSSDEDCTLCNKTPLKRVAAAQ